MKTLTVEEATSGLGRWVELALAGERIQIRKGDGVVELRPTYGPSVAPDQLSAREALRRLQEESGLTAGQAQAYLDEVREERLANEH